MNGITNRARPALALSALLVAAAAGPAGVAAQDLADATVRGPSVDVTQATDYVFSTFSGDVQADQARYASDVYMTLLERLPDELAPEERKLARRHFAQFMLIAPEALVLSIADVGPGVPPEEWSFRDEAAEKLHTWWRSVDPVPATLRNERLEEHLARVAYAQVRYPDDRHPTGVDVRGQTYVRYGAPFVSREIRFNDPEIMKQILIPGVMVNRSEFADSEFWVYRNVDHDAYFLFVKRNGRYVNGTPHDLLPRTLRGGFEGSSRGTLRSSMAIAMLHVIYRQLSQAHPYFGTRFMELDEYVARMFETAFSEHFAGLLSAAAERNSRSSSYRPIGEVYPTESPDVFAQRIVERDRSEDLESLERRMRELPLDHSNVLERVDRLPMNFRMARFLDADGSTRTEVYWAPEPGAVRLADRDLRRLAAGDGWRPDRYLLNMTIVDKNDAFKIRHVESKPFLVEVGDSDDETLPVQQSELGGLSEVHHLALQWDQHLTDGGVRVGPVVKMEIARLDSLQPLANDPGRLEMSDLKPVLVQPGAQVEVDAGVAYPFIKISPELQLALYFELYHLTFGAGDLVRYDVEYEISRRSGNSPLRRLLGRTRTERTAVQLEQSGNTRTAREYIQLDLDEHQEEGPIEIAVNVRDRTSGQRVSRTIRFEMVR